MDWSFFRGKRILITGHTGFKGSWMSRLLLELGAGVYGYALEAPTEPSMFALCGLQKKMVSYVGDIRDLEKLQRVVKEVQPEFIVHMAAQPIVRESYRNPVYTYEVNVMGTVNILECVRQNPCVKSFLNVTTDKVYKNREWLWGYRENEELNGYDPYSNSKSCSELVTSSYCSSFFPAGGERKIPVSTARAGNVIGGGDFAADRIIPDCVRALMKGDSVCVRNPHSVRPYQHVLEPVAAYLIILQRQSENPALAGSYNVGPEEGDCWETGRITQAFCDAWERYAGSGASWRSIQENGPHEANFLRLDCAKLKSAFGWKPHWNAETAIDKAAEWYAQYASGKDMDQCTAKQIREFLQCGREAGGQL